MPREEDIGKAYRNYFTHVDSTRTIRKRAGRYRRLADRIKASYRAARYDYAETVPLRVARFFALPVYLSPLHRPDLDCPFTYLRSREPGRVLEIGCGAGEWLRLVQGQGWYAEGVDFDPVAAECARAKGLTVRTGQVQEQGYADESFDLLLMSHVIEHVHDPLRLLSECRRILKPGGLAVVWTPNGESWGHRKYRSDWTGLHPPQHLMVLNHATLESLGASAGFRSTRCFTTIRTTASYFVAGHRLRKLTRAARPNLLVRSYGYSAALTERFMMLFRPFVGEELVAEMRK
jgi:SAM-dependent methyltransferase